MSGEAGGTSHLFMILFQVDQLLLQALHLHLQVRPGGGEIVQSFAQSCNVALHRHAHSQLILVPSKRQTVKSFSFLRPLALMLPPTTETEDSRKICQNQLHQFNVDCYTPEKIPAYRRTLVYLCVRLPLLPKTNNDL